jgi:hypothetical protein
MLINYSFGWKCDAMMDRIFICEGSSKHYATKKLIPNLASFIIARCAENPSLCRDVSLLDSTLQLQVPRIALTQHSRLDDSECRETFRFTSLSVSFFTSRAVEREKVINERWMVDVHSGEEFLFRCTWPRCATSQLLSSCVVPRKSFVRNLKNAGQKQFLATIEPLMNKQCSIRGNR